MSMHIPAHKNVAHPPGQYQPVEPDYLLQPFPGEWIPADTEETEFLHSEAVEAAS